MSDISRILTQLEQQGVELRLDGDEVVLRHYKGVVGADTLRELKAHKAAVIALLRSRESANDKPTPCPVCGDSERWATTRGPVCPTCWLARTAPEPTLAPAYIKRCDRCGGTDWGFSGRYEADGCEVWRCMRCHIGKG